MARTDDPRQADAGKGEPPERGGRFVPVDELEALFAGSPPVDLDRLRADLDAIADPTPHDPR